jgi:hypothetical protein
MLFVEGFESNGDFSTVIALLARASDTQRDVRRDGSGISGHVWTLQELVGLLVTPLTGADMSRVLLGIICGLVFGAIDIGIMLPMSFPDKKAAITAAFIARFGIGFVIGAARLPWPGWAVGLCFGLLLSIPDAIITKAYGPIIGMGAIGGTIIGVIIGRFGR